MASLQDIRRRIKSVKSTQKITNAMDMIARSRFNSAKDALVSNIPYVEKTHDIIKSLMTQMHGLENESQYIMTRQQLAENRENGIATKSLYLVIASDKGLAGAFASNVLKKSHETIEYDGTSDSESEFGEENFHAKNLNAIKNVSSNPTQKNLNKSERYSSAHGGISKRQSSASSNTNAQVAKEYNDADYIEDVEIITIGRKATAHFRRRGYNIIKSYHGISDRPSYYYAQEIANLIIDRFTSGEIFDVTMIYTRFRSAISCTPDDVTLLPLITDDYVDDSGKIGGEYIYEPDVNSVLEAFLPQRIAIRIYGAMLHSAASELSSRMNAMSNATDNAQELIGKLNLHYNKVRQSGITNEITEIVGGAEALT